MRTVKLKDVVYSDFPHNMFVCIKNAKILTEKDEAFYIEEHDILIRDHKVFAFDRHIPNVAIIDLKGNFLLPQFFNIHSHLGESLYDLNGNNWNISKYLKFTSEFTDSKTESENDQIWNDSAEKSIRLMKESGSCGFCAARSALKAKEADMLAMSGYPLMMSEKLKRFRIYGITGFLKHCNMFRTSECSVGVFLHSIYKSDANLLELAKKCMENNSEFITVHISEDNETREQEERQFEKNPVFVLDEYGLLVNTTILVHGACLTEDELFLVSEKKASIAICPVSSVFLNSKTADPYDLNKKNIKWCIGSDGLATGRTFSLLEQIKSFKEMFPQISNTQILRSVTQIPASLFKRSVYTGLVEPGTRSSFIVLNNSDSCNIECMLENLFRGKTEYNIISI